MLESSFIISSEELITGWEPHAIEQLRTDHLMVIIAMKPEVVLLGTGKRQRFPVPSLLAPLMEAGIGCEVMDSTAACRTYNVLNSEGRQVVAALLPWYVTAMVPLAMANVLLNNLLARPASMLVPALCVLGVALAYLFAPRPSPP